MSLFLGFENYMNSHNWLTEAQARMQYILNMAISEYTLGLSLIIQILWTSDHIILLLRFSVSLHVQFPPPFKRVYHWKSAPCNHIRGYFH